MLKGVQDSDIFLLVLTKGVLQRPFCQLELREAIKLKKRVQLLMEVCDCDTGRVGLSQHAPLCRACSVFPHGTVRSPLSARPGSHIKPTVGAERPLTADSDNSVDAKVDPRFDAFDEEAWRSGEHGSAHAEVVAEIERRLPEAITYRRRGKEAGPLCDCPFLCDRSHDRDNVLHSKMS